jgi:hypothetical protein
MANALDFAGFIVEAIRAVQRSDTTSRTETYEGLVRQIITATKRNEGEMTFARAESICCDHGITTAHLTKIMKSL